MDSKLVFQLLFAALMMSPSPALAQEDPDPGYVPMANLTAGMGFLAGKTKFTLGNMDRERRPYYTFRNIPYATGVSGQDRYKQSVAWSTPHGTEQDPYNAEPTGPLCYQGGLSADAIATLNEQNVQDLLVGLIDGVLESLLPVDNVPDIGATVIVNYLIDLLENLLELEDVADKTVAELAKELLDMDLSVSEECLHLTVSTPQDPSNYNLTPDLPVMVWVHGGGFTSGTSIGNDLARLGDVADVVVVSINYRLGPLGFTCLDTPEAAGNMGLLDVVKGLEWVQTHISNFGGDPSRVTIFGESAGSASIGHLVLSPATEGLFAQGIGQSGSALSPWAFDEFPDLHARDVAAISNCTQDDPDELVACLRALDAEEINAGYAQYVSQERLQARLGFGGSIPCAQKEGDEMFYSADKGENPESLLIEGNYRELPVFAGANSHEGSYMYGVIYNDFIVPQEIESNTDFLTYEFIEVMLRSVDIQQSYAFRDLLQDYYFKPYMMGDLELMTMGAIDILSTFFIKASSYALVEYNAERAPSYWYSIEHINDKKSMYNVLFLGSQPKYVTESGVCHADELLYLFDIRLPIILCPLQPMIPDLIKQIVQCGFDNECVAAPDSDFMMEYQECLTGELNDEEQVWSDRLVRAWTNFATHSDPTYMEGGDLPILPAWTRDQPNYIAFRSDGASIQTDYPSTYNREMLKFDEKYTGDRGTTSTTTGSTTVEGGDGGQDGSSTMSSTTEEGDDGSAVPPGSAHTASSAPVLLLAAAAAVRLLNL